MKKGRKYLLPVAVALVLACAIVCQGRVFMRWNAASQGAQAMEKLGGKLTYDAAMTVNGGRGRLMVFSFDGALAETTRRLSGAFGIDKFNGDSETMAIGSATSGDNVIKLIALSPGSETQTLVFMFEQSSADAKASGDVPQRHYMEVVSPYPGSDPVFYAKDDNTGMSLEISTTAAGAGDARAFFDSSLAGAGWKPAMPEQNSGFAVFQRGSEVSCVLIAADETTGRNRITVLHKPLEIK
jgi:hypothetical protein